MDINLAHNPFVLPASSNRLTESTQVESSNRSTTDVLQVNRLDSQVKSRQTEQSNRLFSLNPRQSRQLSDLQNRDNSRGSQNLSISQYLETENIARREEIESLVGLDLFV